MAAGGMVIKGLEAFQKKLSDMRTRSTTGLRAYLNTVVYRQIQNAQMQRWITEGSSEGSPWSAISSVYASYKKRRYGGGVRYSWVGGRGPNRPWTESGNWPNYPGSGTKLLIATGNLVSSVIGPVKEGSVFGLTGSAKDHRKLVGENSIFVGTTVTYAQDVNDKRNFTQLSVATKDTIFSGIAEYIASGLKA